MISVSGDMVTRLGLQSTWQGWSCSAVFHICLLSAFALVSRTSSDAILQLSVHSVPALTVELSLFESTSMVSPAMELDVAVAPAAVRIRRQEYRLDSNTDGESETWSSRRGTERAASSLSTVVPLAMGASTPVLEPTRHNASTDMPRLLPRKLPEISAGTIIPSLASTVVRSPEFVENRPPNYPRQAVAQGWQGMVWLRLRIAKDGHMLEVTVDESSGHAVLDAAAVAAVRQWRAAPIDDGTAAVVRLPVRFELP